MPGAWPDPCWPWSLQAARWTPALRTAAALASATLRDELLAPGFLTGALSERVRAARTAGASITVDFARQEDAALVETARELLDAALADLGPGDDVTLQVHPSADEDPAVLMLILRARSLRSDHADLRRNAAEYGALISDLDDGKLLRLQPRARRVPDATQYPPLKGDPLKGGYRRPAPDAQTGPRYGTRRGRAMAMAMVVRRWASGS